MASESLWKLSDLEQKLTEIAEEGLLGGVYDPLSALLDSPDVPMFDPPEESEADFEWHDGKLYGILVKVELVEVERDSEEQAG